MDEIVQIRRNLHWHKPNDARCDNHNEMPELKPVCVVKDLTNCVHFRCFWFVFVSVWCYWLWFAHISETSLFSIPQTEVLLQSGELPVDKVLLKIRRITLRIFLVGLQ